MNQYNSRLFSKGFRGYVHRSRFRWLHDSISRLNLGSFKVLELGCFDAKTINFLPVVPERYVGYDSNWEGGLTLAKQIWKNNHSYEFHICNSPKDFQGKECFDISICMETLEHLPPDEVEAYISILAKRTKKFLFVTIPNEKGFVFGIKYILKTILGFQNEKHSFADFVYALSGKMGRIKGNQHKGFDYSTIISLLENYFDIIETHPCPITFLPICLGFGICLICRPLKTNNNRIY